MYEDEITHIAFADEHMVRHLLALLPADAVAGLDARRLRRLPAELIGRGLRGRVADMAWVVGAPSPQRPHAEALLLLEFQSAPHRHMALRMESYTALLREEMAAKLPNAEGPPPVLPVLVYTGHRPWQPPGVRQLSAPVPAGLRRWQPDLEMLVLDAAALSADDGDINPAAALLRLQRCRQPAELPGLAATLFRALRWDRRPAELLERLSDALMRMLVARFGGDETDERYAEELRGALRHMEEPKMLAETVTRWRQEALDEGKSEGLKQGMSRGLKQGMSRGLKQGMAEGERTLLRRIAARRFGAETGDALATLLANEEDTERLAEVGELMLDCTSPEELLRRGGGLLNGRD